MPVWAEFYHRLGLRPARPPTRSAQLIVGNADDVITALKCCGLRHMDRRLRLTAHLERVLDEVPHDLPPLLDRREQAFYLQGTFFNTAVVQSSEATAHVLMVLAADESLQRAARRTAALDRALRARRCGGSRCSASHTGSPPTTSRCRTGVGHPVRVGAVLQLPGVPRVRRAHPVRRGRQPALPGLAPRPDHCQGGDPGAPRRIHVRDRPRRTPARCPTGVPA